MRVGFIGLGNMGHPMATHILQAGYELNIHDVRRETGHGLEAAGAMWADTPEIVASRSDLVLTSLPSPQVVEQVVLGGQGVFAGLAAGATLVDTSTNAPSVMRRISEIGQAQGIYVLDAPISGGVTGARDATLTLFVGGAAEDLERVRPVLEVVGENIVHAGPPGSGNVIKLINNLMMFVNFVGSCEGVAMGARAGIDPRVLLDAITPSMGQSRIFERTLSSFLIGAAWGASTELAVKDMQLAVALAEELDVPVEVSSLVQDIFTRFRDEGNGRSEEFTDMIQYYLNR